MASKSPKAGPVAIPIEAFGADAACRRELAGHPEMPRKSGNRPTASKHPLLKAIEELGDKW